MPLRLPASGGDVSVHAESRSTHQVGQDVRELVHGVAAAAAKPHGGAGRGAVDHQASGIGRQAQKASRFTLLDHRSDQPQMTLPHGAQFRLDGCGNVAPLGDEHREVVPHPVVRQAGDV